MTQHIRSPLPWIGGKHYSAKRIVAAFPDARLYDTYVELFGGAAHVFIQKPPSKHIEVYNDINSALVNFWLQCRDNAAEVEARSRTLPYSRHLYYHYHKSLYDGTPLDPLEYAVRWFYVLTSSFTGSERHSSAAGWNASADRSEAHAYHSALDLFTVIQARFRNVMIDNRDFARVFHQYNHERTFFYVDPPYIEAEHYYDHPFTLADHQRLADVLNSSSSLVALSYYPHPLVEELYPPPQWRRITWETVKHSQRSAKIRDRATELLLCNYPAQARSLWEEESQQEGVA
jgi:DNA adenine methylase